MYDSIAAKTLSLMQRILAARQTGDAAAQRQAREELISAYTQLGNREAGTLEEQNRYIIARRLGGVPPPLQQVDIKPEELPMPAARPNTPPPPPCPPTAATDPARRTDGEDRVAGRFAFLNEPDDEPQARFTVEPRPGDNMRYHGELLPYAVIDTHDGKPVAWYHDRDFAETIADTVSRLREAS